MDAPNTILVPVDLSERSERAVAYAAMLAEKCGAELVLFTNVNLPERALLEDFVEGESTSVEDAAEVLLRRIASRLAPDTPTSVLTMFADFPAEGILRAVANESADMIVLASHGRGGMQRWLLGSVAEKIVRTSEVPVLVVPARP